MASLTCEEHVVGAFSVFLHPDAASPLTHAVPRAPVESADALDAEVAAVLAFFREHGRRARFEFCLMPWGNLPATLTQAGLVLDEEAPLLVCTPDRFRPRAAGLTQIRRVGPRDDLAFLAALMRQGFEVRGVISADDVAGLEHGLEKGLRYVVAKIDGAPAGSGCSAPSGDTMELTAISTLPTMRRRGVAAQVASFLLAEHFDAGGTVAWACAGSDAAYALLQNLGFVDAAVRASYVAP
jgi:hypothetical protein